MIKETLYKATFSQCVIYVIANNYAEAEKLALGAMHNSDIIYNISKEGKVFRPKTKTITIDV